MIITNNHDLPAPLYGAVCHFHRELGEEIHVSDLNSPARANILKREVLEIDASELLVPTYGSMLHEVLRAIAVAQSGYELGTVKVEERMVCTFEIDGESVELDGMQDYYDSEEGLIADYKFTTVNTAMSPVKNDWIMQLNVYRLMRLAKKQKVEKLQVWAMMKDWYQVQRTRRDYPAMPFRAIDVPILPESEVRTYILDYQHRLQNNCSCTTKETSFGTEKPYAVMKNGAAKASKLFEFRPEAELWMSRHKDTAKMYIEERTGVRCKFYCPARYICQDYKGERM
jgi:hypothetical protein